VTPTVIESPADWLPAAITARSDWIHHFSDAEVAEIDRALAEVRRRGLTLADLQREDFPLPTVAQRLAHARDLLEEGPGLYLFRGFPAGRYGKADLRAIYWGLGRHMGTAVSQSKNGDVLGDVRDIGVDMHSPQGRGYTSNQKLTYHTDSCDVVGLFVLCTARTGGLSMICSSVAVHNEIARTRPDRTCWRCCTSPFTGAGRARRRPATRPTTGNPSSAATRAASRAATCARTSSRRSASTTSRASPRSSRRRWPCSTAWRAARRSTVR
jgi:hypothetical protein